MIDSKILHAPHIEVFLERNVATFRSAEPSTAMLTLGDTELEDGQELVITKDGNGGLNAVVRARAI